MAQTKLVATTLNLFNFCAPPFSFYQLDSCYTTQLWQQKTRWLNRLLQARAPSFVGFQEVFSDKQLAAQCTLASLPHFITCDEATKSEDNEFLYTKPIVALASRYPITSHECIESDLKSNLNINAAFSRKPIKAYISHPDYGLMRIYVVHLKSQRPTTLEALSLPRAIQTQFGSIISQQQRAQEAFWLFSDFLFEQHARPLPTIIMGDFNQALADSELSYLLHSHPEQNEESCDLILCDSFLLSSQTDKPPTHFYQTQGRCLDYLLVNKTLLSTLGADALRYHQIDDYLDQTDCGFGPTSDHACVSIEIG